MVIKRIIDGREYSFTLTSKERTDAYYEQQAVFDREDVESVIDSLDAEELNEMGIVPQEALSKLDALAGKYREALDKRYSSCVSYSDTVMDVLYAFFGSKK